MDARTQSSIPHAPAAGRFVEHGLFLPCGRSLGDYNGAGGTKAGNLLLAALPAVGYGGRLQDNQ
jgi:hypothetical protein